MDDASRIFRESIDLRKIDLKEFFWVMLLSHSNNVLGISEIGKGNASAVIVNIKEIFQLAIRGNASSVILCHNHPSGNLNPSQADIRLTKKIQEAGQLLEISILDHIIITTEGHTSLMEKGHM
jgi:DNA repair protein RadC